jgi:hypothetical protein
LSCGGKTVKAFWERRVKVEGSYIFDHGENLEAFFKATGDDSIHRDYTDYKMHMHENGKVFQFNDYVSIV